MATLVADMVRTMSAELPKRTYDSMTRRLLGSALEDMTDLVDSKVQEKVDRIRTALQTLLSISRTRVKTIPFQLVDGDTLRIYTDSSLLLSALDLITWQKGDQGDSEEGRTGEGYGGTGPELWFESVRRLDMAIIVAGAARTRGEWVHRLISAVQDHLPGLGDARVRKRRRLSIPRHALSTPSTLSPFAASPIPERSPPSPSDYAAEASKPFIIRNYISDDGAHPRWPAMQRWRDATYLLDAVGRGRVVPVEIGSSYDSEEWGQQIIAFETFLQSAGWDIPHEQCSDIESRPLYLAQTALFAQFPALEKDFSTPEYVFSEPRSTLPSYSAPDEPLINVWIGPGRNVTSPAHTDPYFNCYAQVLGSKRVWLAPPSSGPHMSAYNGEEGLAGEYMTNTSTVPILQDVDGSTDMKERYPAFFEHVYPSAMEAVLNPGDLLVMPPGWWHAMRGEGEDMCWSVSFWY